MADLHVRRRWIEVEGRPVFFLDGGDGPPVVLLASMVVLAASYRTTLRALAPRFRTLVVELPGCGRGPRLDESWDFRDYGRFVGSLLAALRAALGIERPVLVGHSNSGAAALAAAAFHPDHLSHLAITGAVGADEAHSLVRVLSGRAVDGVIEWKLSLAAWHHPAYNLLFHTRNFLHEVWLAAKSDLLDLAPRVRVPTLLAWGRLDHTMPLRCARALYEHLPDPTLYVSRTGSHDWIVDHPEEYAAALSDFLNQRPGDGDDSPRSARRARREEEGVGAWGGRAVGA